MFSDLLTGEAQRDKHHWAATFGGHAWLGLGPWGIIAIATDMWTAAWVTPLLYLICWEGLQWSRAGRRNAALFWDCILDAVAVAFACYAATLLGNDYQIAAVMCWGASVGVMATGWTVRA